MKKILCIIPAYNAGKYIRQTIRAIKAQEYKNINIVVVDDASPDDTTAKALAENVKVYSLRKNVGTYQAVNYALRRLKSFDYFYIHGADDIPYRNHFAELTKAIETPGKLMAYCCYRRMEYHTGKDFGTLKGTRSSMVLWKKQVLDKIGLYDDTRFGGDSEYWDRFLMYYTNKNMAFVDKPLANCIMHGKNLTQVIGMEKRQAYVAEYRGRHIKLNGRHVL